MINVKNACQFQTVKSHHPSSLTKRYESNAAVNNIPIPRFWFGSYTAVSHIFPLCALWPPFLVFAEESEDFGFFKISDRTLFLELRITGNCGLFKAECRCLQSLLFACTDPHGRQPHFPCNSELGLYVYSFLLLNWQILCIVWEKKLYIGFRGRVCRGRLP